MPWISIYAASLHKVSSLKHSRLLLISSLHLSNTTKTKTKSGREWKTTSNQLVVIVFSMRYFDRAALFAEACQEFGFLSPEEENNSILLKSWFFPLQFLVPKRMYRKYIIRYKKWVHHILLSLTCVNSCSCSCSLHWIRPLPAWPRT